MLLFIVPMFAKMFDDLGGTLPAPTRVLVFLSRRAARWSSRSSSSASSRSRSSGAKVKHTERVRNVVDPLKLKMPVFGSLFQKIALARFARNLGTMLRSGVPILQSLDIVADTTGNVVLARAVARRAGERPQRRVAGRAAAEPPGLPADGRADDGRR